MTSELASPPEKRKAPRIPIALTARVRLVPCFLSSSGQERGVAVLDLSHHGLSFATMSAFTLNEIVEIEANIGDGSVVLHGTVRRASDDPGSVLVVGIEFIRTPSSLASMKELRAWYPSLVSSQATDRPS